MKNQTNKNKADMTYKEFYQSQISYYEKIAKHINNFTKTKNYKDHNQKTAKELLDMDYKKFQVIKTKSKT